jgi:hypothetical protein
MPFTIFYSWQLKRDKKYNKYFIEECIESSVKKLRKDFELNKDYFIITKDTEGIPGSPNVITELKGKIRKSDLFIGDLTYNFLSPDKQEGVSNQNVVQEMSLAEGIYGTERIITVMNTVWGERDLLPFNLRQTRFPCEYQYDETIDKTEAKSRLVKCLTSAIKLIFETVLERTKEYSKPFVNWTDWRNNSKPGLNFEMTDYVKNLFETIRAVAIKPRCDIRICGLSGIGKTRLLLECFRHGSKYVAPILTDRILYVNANEIDKTNILNAIKSLIEQGEDKTLIVDNCAIELYQDVKDNIRSEKSKLSLITVSSDPDEKIRKIDSDGKTSLLIIDNKHCKNLVRNILTANFSELESREIELLVDFSSGIPLIATLMLEDPDRGKYEPGSLKVETIINRLLGQLYSSAHGKAVINCCALFSDFGFFDELEYQYKYLAQDIDLCNLDFSGNNPEDISELKDRRFREVCLAMQERQLLEKRGRSFAFRPSPLAIRMAENWWNECTEQKFNRIIPIIEKAGLVESFCRQFQFLKHISNAQEIISKLCKGLFSSAEVLNTSTGSRLFRSFVYVNPKASENALVKAFASKSKTELYSISEGRRNLVWALENLCYWNDTFDESVKILAQFAVAENENIGNNATGQFIQLFHIYLPGTEVNLERRFKIISYCLNQSEDFKRLGINAIRSALNADHFHRMGVPADEDGKVKDFNPTGSEVYHYWNQCISNLENLIRSNELKDDAIKALFDKFYIVCSNGAGKIIIPLMQSLLKEGFLDRMELRKRVKMTLSTNRGIDSESIQALEELSFALTPNTFEEKFEVLVQIPSRQEYLIDPLRENVESAFRQKLEVLASQLLDQPDNWDRHLPLMISGQLIEGYNFGVALASVSKDIEQINKIKDHLISDLHKISVELRNISVLLGIQNKVADEQFSIHLFNQFLNNNELANFCFLIARNCNLPILELKKLIILCRKGVINSNGFSSFEYGWGLKHLKAQEIKELLDEISSIDQVGKTVVFFIMEKWLFRDKELWIDFKSYMRKHLLEDSEALFQVINGSNYFFEWSQVAVYFLKGSGDVELATFLLEFILNKSNNLEDFYKKEDSFFKIFEILVTEYFGLFWQRLSEVLIKEEEYHFALYNLKRLLGSRHDFNFSSEGILFGANPNSFDIIFNWCEGQSNFALSWIGEMIPIYNLATPNADNWHTYSKKFIDQYGDRYSILGGISAHMNTYSWSDSVVPKLESDLKLFSKLVDHKISEVREWAKVHLEDLEKRIKWETNREVDGYFMH